MINEKERFIPEQQPKPIIEEESQNEYNETDTENPEEQERKKMAKINDLQQEKNQLTGKIERARNNLGLPPTDEESPGVKALNDQIEKIENENTIIEQPKTEYVEKAEKQKFFDFVDSVKKIKNIFQQRIRDRLRPLIDEQKLSALLSASFNIENMFEQKISPNDWSDKLVVEINKIKSAIDSIEGIRTKSSFGEDAASLSNLRSKLKTLEVDSRKIIIGKQNQESEDSNGIKKALNALSQSCGDKWQFIARLGQAFENYKRVR